MIAYLQGNAIEFEEQNMILNVNSVGYELACSNNSIADFMEQKEVIAYVYTHVREDQISLFGFSTKLEKQLFLSFLKVNGVGPKMALSILSGASLDQLISWIEANDVKALCQLPKVGKKTAEQIILSLKGKLVFADEQKSKQRPQGVRSEVYSALMNLGFQEDAIEPVVASLDTNLNFEDSVRQALLNLSGV